MELHNDFGLGALIGDEDRLRRYLAFMEPAGLIVGGRVAPNWLPDGRSFWFASVRDERTHYFQVDGDTGAITPLFAVQAVRDAIAACVGDEWTSDEIADVRSLDGGALGFSLDGGSWVLDLATHVCAPAPIVPSPAADLREFRRQKWQGQSFRAVEIAAPGGAMLAGLADGNILIRPNAGGDASLRLTEDGGDGIGWDIECPLIVSTGRTRSPMPWSPDGRLLFAIRYDRQAVESLRFMRFDRPQEYVDSVSYHRAGGPIDIGSPHIFNVASGARIALDVGHQVDRFFSLVGWRPDGKEVLFASYTRDFKAVDLLAADPTTGSVRIVLRENAPTFVANQLEVLGSANNHVTILEDGCGLIWRSARSGWEHFYLYDLDGMLIGALTGGDYSVIDVVAVDYARGRILFTAHHDPVRPYDTHLCSVDLCGHEVTRLTSLDGENVPLVSPSCETFICANGRVDRPTRSLFYRADGTELAELERADLSCLCEIGEVAPEEFSVTAADGETTLWGVMFKPADFDPALRYPVIDYLYGGPQMTMAPRRHDFAGHGLQRLGRALAQLGYIVVSLDARGTPERSKAFQDVVAGNWGRHEIADHAAAIRELGARHDYIDLGRAGVMGHSWGGYFTIRALIQEPDLFRVGVAIAPGNDPADMMIFEPYLGPPDAAAAAYAYGNNNNFVSEIAGKLMIVCGTADPARPGIVMRLIRSLIDGGVDHDIVMLPESGHTFEGGNDHYYRFKLVQYFERHLKGRECAS